MRICSLLPSSTEIVFALGLGDRLVGITHECDYPPGAGRPARRHRRPGRPSRELQRGDSSTHFRGDPRGQRVYALDQGLLERLDPDLILTQELCDVCAVSYEVVQRAVRMLPGDRRVLSLEPTNLDGILQTILSVGRPRGALRTPPKTWWLACAGGSTPSAPRRVTLVDGPASSPWNGSTRPSSAAIGARDDSPRRRDGRARQGGKTLGDGGLGGDRRL